MSIFLEYFPAVYYRLPLNESLNLFVPELTILQNGNEVFLLTFCMLCVLKL